MKITKVHLRNWLCHSVAEFPLTPMSIICGPNGAGKSAIADAISYAITGETRRGIATKAERVALLNEGAVNGYVEIEMGGGSIKRDILTGKSTSSSAVTVDPGSCRDAISYLLDQPRFSASTEDGRRELLQKVLRAESSAKIIHDMLVLNKHDVVLVDSLTGEPATWGIAADKGATEARGAWKAIAGEAYGTVKAETFTSGLSRAQVNPAAGAALERTIADLDATISALDTAIGAIAAHRQDDGALRASLQRAAKLLDGAKSSRTDSSTRVTDLRARALTAKSAVEEIQGQVSTRHLSCPDCGAFVQMEAGELVSADVTATTYTTSDITAAREKLAKIEADISEELVLQGTFQAAVKTAETAQADLAALPAPSTAQAPPVTKKADLELERADVATRRDAARAALTDHRVASKAQIAADQKIAQLDGLHATAQKWVEISKDLAPDGIPAKLLQKVIGPFNDTLREFSAATGWRQVALGADMRVMAAGRPYALLSESEQWRADTMLTVALAVHSQLKFTVLDRFDLLDVTSRRKALAWLFGLTKSGNMETIIVLGTMKDPPQVPSAICVHWLGETLSAEKVAA